MCKGPSNFLFQWRLPGPITGIQKMRLIKLTEVMHRTGLARSTIYKFIASGFFPKSVNLSVRAVAWVESELEE